jgi:AcrR family transcriptional regulator
MTATKPRLTADDWLRAGFRALVEAGPVALKAEPLSRALGTTKGSFYWHFRDIPDFHNRLLNHWKDAAEAALARAGHAQASPTERLHRLAEITAPEDDAHGGAATEAAIRAWAQADHTVADAVAEVDAARLAYTASVLAALGLTNPDFARLLYGAHLGMQVLPGSAAENDGALSTLTAALLALQDA